MLKKITDQKLQKVLRQKRTAELSNKPAIQFSNKKVSEIVVNYRLGKNPPERIGCFSSPKTDFLKGSIKHKEFKDIFYKLHTLQLAVLQEHRLNWYSLSIASNANSDYHLELLFSCPSCSASRYSEIISEALGSDPNTFSLKIK